MNAIGRILSVCIRLCLATMILMPLLGMNSRVQAETITLRFATYHPPLGLEGEVPKWMMAEITKRTNGKVKFEEYFAGSLLKARELLKGVQSGTADMGFIFTPYFPKELGLLSILHPFIRGPISPAKTVDFFQEFFANFPEADGEIQRWNQKRIAVHIFGKLGIGSHKPIKDLTDITGLKIRAPGGFSAQWLQCLGANVVFLKSSDVYSAFQKNAIDAVFSPPTSQYRSKWYETADPYYLLVIPMFSGVCALITMNLDKWNSLPPDIQQTVSAVGKEYASVLATRIVALEHEYISKMKSAGAVVSEASEESIIHWADKCEGEAKAKWIAEADKMGLAGDKLMARLMPLIKKYSR